jgi:NitT/TauT family transport system substrate-binding protein
VVDSWFETLGYINKGMNKDESDQIMAKRAGVSMAEYKDYLDGTKIFDLEQNLEAFQPGTDTSSLPRAAAEANKSLVENKLIKAQVDISKIFDDRFVKAYAAKTKGK